MRTLTDIRSRRDSDEGFTLIELLVIVLIIGVLAAIAIPAFLSQRENAYLATVKTDLRNASIAAESFAVLNNGYAGLTDTALQDNGYTPSTDVHIDVQVSTTSYELVAVNSKISPTKSWVYDGATGQIRG